MSYFDFEGYVEKVSSQCNQNEYIVRDVINGQISVAGIELAKSDEASTWLGYISLEDNKIKLTVTNDILERILSGKVLPIDIVRKMINT